MEIFVWLLTGSAVYAFLKERFWIAGLLIGFAAAIKLIPILFFVLLLERRRYREIALGIVAAGVFTLASMWMIDPHMSFTYHQIQAGLASYQQDVVSHYYAMLSGYDHSLFGFIKQIFHNLTPARYRLLVTIYDLVIGVAALVLYFRYMRHLPIINRVLCLTVACLLLPPTSYDYRLIHLYTPWVLLVLFAVESCRAGQRHVAGLWPVFLCFAVLMSQVGEVIYHTVRGGGQIKALALIYLLYLALKHPFHSSFDDDPYRTPLSAASMSPEMPAAPVAI